jgi:regulator of sigma E protease
MDILIKAGQLILSLSILVIIHELGHFTFAKMFKTRVEKFYLFFDAWFSLFKFKRGETEYGIGWIPLGGYVKISGMIDESMDKEQMALPPQDYEFRSKNTWQRLLIMIGGVLFNFILAIVIYIGVLFVWGEKYLPAENVKYGIMCDTLAYEIGLKDGDQIVEVNNKKVVNFKEIVPQILLEDPESLTIQRNGETVELPIDNQTIAKIIKNGRPFFDVRIPFVVMGFGEKSIAEKAGMKIGDKIVALNGEQTLYYDEFKTKIKPLKNTEISITVERNGLEKELKMKTSPEATIGVAADTRLDSFFELQKKEYTLLQSVPAGLEKGYNEVGDYLKQFKLLFTPETEAYKSLGGFIAIGNIFPSEFDWYAFWMMTALLSIMLGVVNILPIPALDGGHVMFLMYEIVTGRKPSDKFMEYAQITGMVILLGLLIFANGNDIIKLFQ